MCLSFLACEEETRVFGTEALEGKFNYFSGSDPDKWIRGASTFRGVAYTGVWPDVDLEVATDAEGYKLNWMLDTPAHAAQIKLRWQGADSVFLSQSGDQLIQHPFGTLTDPLPKAWQRIGDTEFPVDCAYALDDEGVVSFRLSGVYDPQSPVVIDPMIPFTTYLGADGGDTRVSALAEDGTGPGRLVLLSGRQCRRRTCYQHGRFYAGFPGGDCFRLCAEAFRFFV